MIEKKPVQVILVRRNEANVRIMHKKAIQALFPGREVKYHRTDPTDYSVHAEQCTELQADLVLLEERPLPSLAMEQGVVHCAFIGGELKQLVGITPQFKDLVPEVNPHAEHAYEMSSFGL